MKREALFNFFAFAFWIIFFLASLGIEPLWGVNYLHFLPPFLRYSILGISLLMLILPRLSKPIPAGSFSPTSLKFPYLIIGLALFSFLGIYENVYGDSVLFVEKMGLATSQFHEKYLIHLFSLDLSNPKLGNLTVLSLIRTLSYAFSISHMTAFQILGIVSGLAYLNLGFNYAKEFIKTSNSQWIVLLLILFAPSNQLFLGHFEIYAPAFPACAWYFISLRRYLETREKKQLILTSFALLLCLKFHFSFVLLLPSYCILLGSFFSSKLKIENLNWRSVFQMLIVPFFLIGTAVYFFVLKDFKDERFLNPSVDVLDRLFLPLLSPEAPLDRYNLLSFNHFLDFFNLFFVWSAAALFLLFVMVLLCRKGMNWNRPKLILSGTSLMLFLMVFFAFNPLLGMPMDYDLFSIISPLFLFFVFFILEQVEGRSLIKKAIGPVLSISILSSGFFLCNAKQQSLSLRLESVGKHIFKSYWIRSAGDIKSGLKLIEEDSSQYIRRYLDIAQELEPYALKNKDPEYAHILWSIGKYFRSQEQNYEQALLFHIKAKEYDPEMAANYIGLMESSYYLEKYSEAYQYSLELIDFQYPSEKKALQIAVDCAIGAGLKKETILHLKAYLKKWNEPTYLDLLNRLESNAIPEL